ncbi:hypothetical protein G6F23_011776 [Rhizopus arrhizus]|nr:hypothetical protein G6F23_011776 [Rhizopus arrhizus]
MQATTVYYTATYPSSFPNAETSTTSTSAPASNTQPTDLNSPLGNGIKRKQVKNACTNCQKACKKCDDARPCPRCMKYGIADTCVNSVRKERKKGIKRGPYKRRQKQNADGVKIEVKPEYNNSQTVTETTTTNENTPTTTSSTATPASGNTTINSTNGIPFGYPPNLNQYGQPAYDTYYSVADAAAAAAAAAAATVNSSGSGTPATAAYSKDQIISQQYVLPIYSPYPVLVRNTNENSQNNNQTNTSSEHGTQTSPFQQHYQLLQQSRKYITFIYNTSYSNLYK